MKTPVYLSGLLVLLTCPLHSQSADEVRNALHQAVTFYGEEVATHGGYVYQYSADLTLREAEGIPDPDTIWIQPPGTPAVGEALLNVWKATGDETALQAAKNAATALTKTQMHSGGWYYRGHFGKGREEFTYRKTLSGESTTSPVPDAKRNSSEGWATWRQRDFEQNMTILDDGVTQTALRFLVLMDQALEFKDPAIHEAAEYGLRSMLGSQYPNGAWSANWDRFPLHGSPSAASFPVIEASVPADWSRTWTKDFSGCYVTNDNLHSRCLKLMLLAWDVYQDPRYLDAAKRAGDFLLLAQMPDPQPAWAQAYDVKMHPVWDRAFEPPAVSGRESQYLCLELLNLYQATGDERYLVSADRALQYLKKCQLPDGTIPRFREMETDRPLYFQRGPGGKGHVMTYEAERLASNYGFQVESILDDVERRVRLLRAQGPDADLSESTEGLNQQVQAILEQQDDRGAWAEPGTMRNADGRKVDPEGGIIRSEAFVKNVELLIEFLETL